MDDEARLERDGQRRRRENDKIAAATALSDDDLAHRGGAPDARAMRRGTARVARSGVGPQDGALVVGGALRRTTETPRRRCWGGYPILPWPVVSPRIVPRTDHNIFSTPLAASRCSHWAGRRERAARSASVRMVTAPDVCRRI